MCLFSGEVQAVTNTNIFARASAGDRQYLVYEMTLASRAEVAMVLPLPVPPAVAEDAVRFIALDGYPDLFRNLDRGFAAEVSRGGATSLGAGGGELALRVHDVGDLEASFVPTIGDFVRLDPRFRLAPQVWDALPFYRDYGFAVFKLKPGNRDVHQMAFEFPRRDPSRLFFPTVHVHDGTYHREAEFDHSLYCQGVAPVGWQRSRSPMKWFVDVDRTQGLVDEASAFRSRMRGTFANGDIYV